MLIQEEPEEESFDGFSSTEREAAEAILNRRDEIIAAISSHSDSSSGLEESTRPNVSFSWAQWRFISEKGMLNGGDINSVSQYQTHNFGQCEAKLTFTAHQKP